MRGRRSSVDGGVRVWYGEAWNRMVDMILGGGGRRSRQGFEIVGSKRWQRQLARGLIYVGQTGARAIWVRRHGALRYVSLEQCAF